MAVTPEQRAEWEAMSQVEMASILRFAPIGHPIFTDSDHYETFKRIFATKGGMTATVSKEIGWKGHI